MPTPRQSRLEPLSLRIIIFWSLPPTTTPIQQRHLIQRDNNQKAEEEEADSPSFRQTCIFAWVSTLHLARVLIGNTSPLRRNLTSAVPSSGVWLSLAVSLFIRLFGRCWWLMLYPLLGNNRPAGCSVSCSGSPAGHHVLRGTVSATRATGIWSHRSGSAAAAAGSAGSETARLHPQANQPNQQRWIVCPLTNQLKSIDNQISNIFSTICRYTYGFEASDGR